MLIQYRFDLSSLESTEQTQVMELLNKLSFTGITLVTPTVCTCFFDENEAIDELIPLPAGCIKSAGTIWGGKCLLYMDAAF